MVEEVSAAMTPEIPTIVMGHSYVPREKWKREPHCVAIFPTRAELLEPGPDDGKRFRVAFSFCLPMASEVFDDEPHIDWVVPSRYDGMLDGPHICLTGAYHRHPVAVYVYDRPPKDYPTVTVFESETGNCRAREDN